jgi:hypothetical protein
LNNETTYTFTSQSTGVGLVVVAVSCQSSTQRVLSSATIGGNPATIITSVTSVGGGSQGTNPVQYALIQGVTTTSTNDISVTWDGQCLNTNCAVWRINDYNSTTPVWSGGTFNNYQSTGLSLTTSSLNGTNVGIFASVLGANNTPVTWTNATERYDGTIEAGVPSTSGADFSTTTTGTRAVSTSHNNNAFGEVLIGAVWK